MPIDLSPSALVEASKCYCFPKDLAQRVKNYLYAVIAGSSLTPAQLAAAAACYCYDAKTAKIVLISELCSQANDAGDSALVQCNGAFLANAARCYCFDHATAERVKIWLLAQLAQLGDLTPAQLGERAACYCMDDKRVPLFLLCNEVTPPGTPPEPPEPPEPPAGWRCPDVPVVLKGYYNCNDPSGQFYIADSLSWRHLFSFDGNVNPPLTSETPGIIGNSVYAGPGSGAYAGWQGTGFGAMPDLSYWSGQSFTIRLWCKSASAYDSNDTGPSMTWANFALAHTGSAGLPPGRTTWTLSYFGFEGWVYFGGAGNVIVPEGSDWYRLTVWYCHVTGDVGIQINNDPPYTGLWPPNIGTSSAGFGLFLGTVGTVGSGVSWVDEVAFWRGWLTAAELLTDWNGGAGKTYPDVPGIPAGSLPLAPVNIILSSAGNPAVLGFDFPLTAQVQGVTGGQTITFKDGASSIGTALVDANTLKATFTFSPLTAANLSPGPHSLTAEYAGGAQFAASVSNAVSQSILDSAYSADAATVAAVNAFLTLALTGVMNYDPTTIPVYDEGSWMINAIIQIEISGGVCNFYVRWNYNGMINPPWDNSSRWVQDTPGPYPNGTYHHDGVSDVFPGQPASVTISQTS